MQREKWKPVQVEEFTDSHEVSSCGRVRSLDRTYDHGGNEFHLKGRILKAGVDRRVNTYKVVLTNQGLRKAFYVHRLVAQAFIGECPKGKEVNHKDGDRSNNRANNLEYMTHLENMQHAREVLGFSFATNAKLTASQVLKIRAARERGIPQKILAKRYGVSQAHISVIFHGKTWRHILKRNFTDGRAIKKTI